MYFDTAIYKKFFKNIKKKKKANFAMGRFEFNSKS